MAQAQRALSRRSFCWTLAGVLVTPGIALAQAPNVVRRIGVLEPGAPNPDGERVQGEALRELGWVEGQNLRVERRYANGRSEALQTLAEDLVRAKVEIIVTAGTPATLAAKRATTTIPILIRTSGDPVAAGLVASLARPGSNVTGYSDATPEVTAKRLSLLKELIPRLRRIGVMWEAGNPANRVISGQLEHVCQSLDLVPITVEIGAADEINGVIEQLALQRAQMLILPGSSFVWDHRVELVNAATKLGLPIMADDESMVREGGALITYSSADVEQIRARADYVDRILRGASPADLPVRQPTKFVLVINLTTAKALGITVPKELLLRADEVIE